MMRSDEVRRAYRVFYICLSGVALAVGFHAWAEDSITLSAGHVIGNRGTVMASELFSKISDALPDVDVKYDDRLTDQGTGEKRFEKQSRTADIVCLYAGSTEVLDEVVGLARTGRISPVDGLPGFADLVSSHEIFPNLLSPVTFDGHVWAVPIRVVVPVVAVRKAANVNVRTWDDLFGACASRPVSLSVQSDAYLLWRTLIDQEGLDLFPHGQVDVTPAPIKDAFTRIANALHNARIAEWDGADIIIANTDVLTDNPSVLSDSRVLPLPSLKGDHVYCSAWTWYVGVSSSAFGPRRVAAAKVVSALLSPEIQEEISNSTLGVPPLKSLANRLAKSSELMATLVEMTSRLEFRQHDELSAQVEPILERAFQDSLAAPDRYDAIMGAAAKEANSIIVSSARQSP